MSHSSKSYLLDISLLSTGLLIFFLILLGNAPLHTPDEARYSLVSFQMFQAHQYLVPKINGVAFLDKPPLFYYTQILMLKLFGNSEFALRLPSALSGIFSCLMVYITARKLFNRMTGLSSAVILADFPIFFIMSHYANLDMMVASLINSSLCFFILAQQESIIRHKRYSRLLMWGCYISMAFAMLTKGLIAVAFPCCIVSLYSLIYRKAIKLFLIDGILIFAAIVMPWFVMMHNEVWGFSYYYFIIQHFYRYLSQSFNNQQPFWFYAAVITVSSYPWILFSSKKNWSFKNKNIGFYIIYFAFILLFFSLTSSKPIGYILPAFPPLAILLGYGVCHQTIVHRLTVLSIFSIISGLLLCYPWSVLAPYSHEIAPLALIVAISGSLGLLMQCYFVLAKSVQAKINKRQQSFIVLITITMMFINLNLLAIAQSLAPGSIKPITNYLNKYNKQHLPIAMYYTFYYDLPYYTSKNQPIYAVDNWIKGLFNGDLLIEQFALGMKYHAPKTFISNTDFMKQWQVKSKSLYIVTNKFYSQQLLNQKGKILLVSDGIYLLSNQ